MTTTNIESINGMDEVYHYCYKLRLDYEKKLESQEDSWHFGTEDGERYLKLEYYDKIQTKGQKYYEECLKKYSYRTPNEEFYKIKI